MSHDNRYPYPAQPGAYPGQNQGQGQSQQGQAQAPSGGYGQAAGAWAPGTGYPPNYGNAYPGAYPVAYPGTFAAGQYQQQTPFFNFSNERFVKGMLIGAAAAYLLTNESVQRSVIKGAVKAWSMVQGGAAELKERFHDAEAELRAGEMAGKE